MKLKKPHIVGRSMGGNIALTVGALYSNQISKLGILVSAAKWRHATLNALKYQTQLQELKLNTEIQTEISLSWILSEKSYQNKAFLTMLKNNPNPQSISNQKRQFNIIQKFNGLDYLRKIRAPTLIGYGAEDILALPGDSKYLAQHIANAKLVEFQCGHIIVLEQTQQLADELINFLHE